MQSTAKKARRGEINVSRQNSSVRDYLRDLRRIQQSRVPRVLVRNAETGNSFLRFISLDDCSTVAKHIPAWYASPYYDNSACMDDGCITCTCKHRGSRSGLLVSLLVCRPACCTCAAIRYQLPIYSHVHPWHARAPRLEPSFEVGNSEYGCAHWSTGRLAGRMTK